MIALAPVAEASPQASLDIKVDHVVQIRDGGLIIVNDTAKLSAKPGQSAELLNYTLGFPYDLHSSLDYAFAYETLRPSSRMKLELDAGMGIIGFYGVNVIFPQVVSLSDGEQYEFTVVFVFSGRISIRTLQVGEETRDTFNATFPAYPSLSQNASEVNLTIVLPTGLNYTASSYENDGANFTRTIADNRQYFSYLKANLTGLYNRAGWFSFEGTSGQLEVLEVSEVERDIKYLGLQQIAASDSYRMMSKSGKLVMTEIKLPKEAFDVSAYSEFGPLPTSNLKVEQESTFTNVTITFSVPYEKDKEAQFLVRYQLPWESYTHTETWSSFNSSLTLFEASDWTVRELTTSVSLPEGSTLITLSSFPNSLQRSAFDTSFSFVFANVTLFQDMAFSFGFERSVLWESFRPTLWMGCAVIVVGAIVGAWRTYKPPVVPIPTAISRVRVEDLKKFVDSYDEKRRYQREVVSLETQARKGKIPRRRYKVRRMSIESRLASLSRDLTTLREKIRMAGPRYADMMRQLEVAETELQGVEADISRTEVRYRRGEISAAAYHNLLESSYRRRDRAQTTVDGVLLRLKEEIS